MLRRPARIFHLKIYGRPHARGRSAAPATRWIFENIPGLIILNRGGRSPIRVFWVPGAKILRTAVRDRRLTIGGYQRGRAETFMKGQGCGLAIHLGPGSKR